MADFIKIADRMYEGASGDDKPTGVPNGTICRYTNTREVVITYDGGSTWINADKRVRLADFTGTEVIGKVTASPASNTLLDRLKALLTGIVLAAGTATIGKLGANSGVDIGDVDVASTAIAKTIESELKALTAVAADVQSVSSVLALTNMKQITVFIDHAKDHANASVGQGTEYVVQGSEKASGDDTWRRLAAFTASIAAPTAMVSDAEEVAAQTVIECGSVVPAVGDILFFKNSTLANSEWSNVIARVTTGGSETVTLESGLTNTQAQGTYYTEGEHFVVTIDVSSLTRLRVVANNTKGTTNRAIVWRVGCISQV